MAPKKKETQKMSLGDFLSDQTLGGKSWADEVEDTFASGTQQLPPSDRRPAASYGSGYGGDRDRGYSRDSYSRDSYSRDSYPQTLPDKPPYTAHLGNLSYDATVDTVTDFFSGCDIVTVRIIEDREQQRPKGFAYAEFANVEGLKKALTLDQASFQGRTIRIKIAEPPRDRDGRGDSTRDFSDWTRKGPLPDLPSRGGDRRQGEFGDRRPPREPVDDGKVRDFNTWERKGPLSPLPQQEGRTSSRDGSRPRTNEGNRPESFRNRHQSPAAWGEGRQEGSGSRPPRREFPERMERVPSAADKDMQWRSNMRPDPIAKSPNQSRDGSEAPPSPSGGHSPVPAPGGRPKLNLTKRTVSESVDLPSPAAGGDSKASPFGAARPIDTTAREREIEEKRLQALKEKKEAEDKAKEDRRLAKEAAAKEAAARAEAEAEAEAEAKKTNGASTEEGPADDPKETDEQAQPEGVKEEAEEAAPSEQKVPVRTKENREPGEHREPREPREPREHREHREPREPREPREQREPREPKEPREPRDYKSRATESGNWRQASGEQKAPRAPPSGPRRGGGPPRGPRNEGPRQPRANGSSAPQAPSTPVTAEPDPSTPDEDGWTTVTTVPKGRRSQGPRAVAS